MTQPYIQLDREQWKNLHNSLCSAEQEAGSLFAVLKDGGEGLAALKSVRDALAPAYDQDQAAFDRQFGYFNRVKDQHGFLAMWSLYDNTDVGSFDEPHPYAGATHVVYSNHWGIANKIKVEIPGNGWLDLYRAANEAIQLSSDGHHIYIERFDPIEDKPGCLALVTGS